MEIEGNAGFRQLQLKAYLSFRLNSNPLSFCRNERTNERTRKKQALMNYSRITILVYEHWYNFIQNVLYVLLQLRFPYIRQLMHFVLHGNLIVEISIKQRAPCIPPPHSPSSTLFVACTRSLLKTKSRGEERKTPRKEECTVRTNSSLYLQLKLIEIRNN